MFFFFFQAEDGIRDIGVTGVQTCALPIFPSRYSSAIGHQGVFRLTRWSWQIHGRFQESAATREHPRKTSHFHLPDSHRLRSDIPDHSASNWFYHSPGECQSSQQGPTTPTTQPLTGITRSRFSL